MGLGQPSKIPSLLPRRPRREAGGDPISADGETKAQKSKVTWPRSPSQQRTKLGFKFRSTWHQSSATTLNPPCLECGPSEFRRVQGPFWRHSGQPYLASHSNKKTFEMERLPNKEGVSALNPEPLPHAQPSSQALLESASQVPTSPHHFLPDRASAGKGYTGRRQGGRGPPTPHPAVPLIISDLPSGWLASTHLFPGPSALGAATRTTSPKPQCRWGSYLSWALPTEQGNSVLPGSRSSLPPGST